MVGMGSMDPGLDYWLAVSDSEEMARTMQGIHKLMMDGVRR